MNKFYNKALMYQTFLRGKWTLIVGMFLFTFVTILQTVDNMTEIEMNLAQLSSDRVSLRQFPIMLLMLAILVVLYMVITGFNKRNNLTYFHSGPFNKNQIKINEIIFLVFSLLIMIFIYAYMNICFYFKNRVLIELCYGYFISYFFNILHIFYRVYIASKCNLMTLEDTLCQDCRTYYFLFLLSIQKATSKRGQREFTCFAERK